MEKLSITNYVDVSITSKRLGRLSIIDCVDVSINSKRLGRMKANGLFEVTLKYPEADARDMVYVGDSMDRKSGLREQKVFHQLNIMKWRVQFWT